MRVKIDGIKKLGTLMLETAGAPEDEANVVMEVLIDTSLRGVDSHGVRAVGGYAKEIQNGLFLSGENIKVMLDNPVTAMWDTTDVNGYVVGKRAMEAAIEKARIYKMGAIGCMGPAHNGALYWYTNIAVKEDMVGIVLQRGARQVAAPFGGIDGRLGTNPLAIGIPAGEEKPILLDMATNAVATGHFLTMNLRGERIPEGWVIDREGNWINEYDSEAAGRGDIAPVSFGGLTGEYKGYGIKVVLEALAGAIGSGCSLDAKGRHDLIYMALDPTGFCKIEKFKSNVDSMIRHIKSSKRRPGFEDIYLPGEPESLEKEKRLKEGILLDEIFWEELMKTAKSLGIEVDEKIIL
ncbi:malate/lactate dehydrogenase [Thaumarchaeota archaeon SCGC AB-539-E09]|nr:malate/lactate dehydrogenase [Thaumarchaeota archaeon SCGC AB-539-E09]